MLCLIHPIQPSLAIIIEPKQKLPLMTALSNMPDETRKIMSVRSSHFKDLFKGRFIIPENLI